MLLSYKFRKKKINQCSLISRVTFLTKVLYTLEWLLQTTISNGKMTFKIRKIQIPTTQILKKIFKRPYLKK